MNELNQIAPLLLEWYEANKRDLPWRHSTDAYHIWVSEMMLQQTQVATALDYYRRFLDRFPDISSLASAPIESVMKQWEGLGYYARARNMHKTAKLVVDRFAGQLPISVEELKKLPGIGPYTAGAIASIAHNEPAPILDGNVKRVLARWLAIEASIDDKDTIKMLWAAAQDWALLGPPSEINQAIMEFGALCCRPQLPMCHQCPVRHICLASIRNRQFDLPVRDAKKTRPHWQVTAGVIWDDDKILITLRPPKGLLGGLWEFPGGKQEEGETLEECLRREIREELSIDTRIAGKLMSIDHGYTHFKITLHVFHAFIIGGDIHCHASDDFRWVDAQELSEFAFPAADQKVIDALQKGARPDSF